MSSIGIIGLPNVGKSTLFSALTKKQVDISNYPFCTIEPNIGIIPVPDERLKKIAKIRNSQKLVEATIKFIDIAGLVKGAHQGEGLGNQFLSHIREVDAILHIIRVFKNEKITHVHNKIDPINDIEIINSELIFKDLETIEKKLQKLEKEAKSGDKKIISQKELLENLKDVLSQGNLIQTFIQNLKESNKERYKNLLKELSLLTEKPIIYVLNQRFEKLKETENLINEIAKKFNIDKENIITLDIKLEKELMDLPPNEQIKYKEELNIKDSAIEKIIKKSYQILNLITFFTSNEKETRAWTILKNKKAPEAGAKVHTDFKNKFIKAEVINWKKLINANSWANAKEKGLIRTEGKDYIIQDGDVVLFKI